MNYRSSLVLAAVLAGATPLASAADINRGQELQQENCMNCHDDGVYTRDNRKIGSLSALETQVRRCELTLGLQWFDEDVADVVAYLNDAFYKFK
ncbi:MAG: cytochrome c [Pseudomonadota bacterium]